MSTKMCMFLNLCGRMWYVSAFVIFSFRCRKQMKLVVVPIGTKKKRTHYVFITYFIYKTHKMIHLKSVQRQKLNGLSISNPELKTHVEP